MSEKDNQKNYVRAAYAPDGPGALAMVSLLKENGIDAFRQGGVRDIYKIGGDIFGEEIMVEPENLSRARELLHNSGADIPPAAKETSSPKKAFLSLAAAAVLFFVLLFLRGRFLS